MNQECMILHRVETANRQQRELARRATTCRLGRFRGGLRLHSQPQDADFLGINPREMFENIAAVVLGDGYAEAAVVQFRIEIGSMQKQVRAVQRQAEACSKQPGRNHSNPRTKITMMYVNVLDCSSSQ